MLSTPLKRKWPFSVSYITLSILFFNFFISLLMVSGLTLCFIDICMIVSPLILSSSNSLCRSLNIASSHICRYSVLVKSKSIASPCLHEFATYWTMFCLWFSYCCFSSLGCLFYFSHYYSPLDIVEFSIVWTSVISCVVSVVSIIAVSFSKYIM